jgi:uncharacterized protein YdhG (YjbR/CyaY superfamily)
MSKVPSTVDEYIATISAEVQEVLRLVRATVRRTAPQAEERISYRMPALFQNGVLVYFGAFKTHLGLFPPVEEPALRAKAAPYAGPKGNLKFPYAQPIPYSLIAAAVKARLKSNVAKQAAKRPATKGSPAKRVAARKNAA